MESEDGQAEASNARFRVCFVGSVHYSQPLDATSAKKFRSLETIGRIFVVGFATSLRPVWFKDRASFFLLPSLASPVFRYLMLYSAGLVVTLNWILVHGVTVVVTQGPYEGLCGAVAKQISRLFGRRVALLVESHGDFEQALFLQRRIRFAGLFRWLILRISGFALRRADALRAISRSTSEQLSRWAPGKPIVSFPAWRGPMTLGRPRWGRLSLTQVEITLARLKLFLLPCTFLFAPRQGQPYSHSTPSPKNASPSYDVLSAILGGCVPHSSLSENRSCEIRCTWEGCSYTGGCGPVARCLLSVLLLSAHKALEEFAPRDAEGPHITPFYDTWG